jgi:hypothetical protein
MVIKIIDNLCKTRSSDRPTRGVIVIPEQMRDGKKTDLAKYARSKKLLEIVKFPKGTFRFLDPEDYSQDPPGLLGPFQGEVSIFLFLNSRSLLFDPINWSELEWELQEWINAHCPQGEVSYTTKQKFTERIQVGGDTRAFGGVKKKIEILNLMSGPNQRADPKLVRKLTGGGPLLKLVKDINKGDKGLATLGLFPYTPLGG